MSGAYCVVSPLARVAWIPFQFGGCIGREKIGKGEKVAKKEKTIAVSVKDIERAGQLVEQVLIGDRVIGEVVAKGVKFEAHLMGDQQTFMVKSQEEGLETILAQYHLHQG